MQRLRESFPPTPKVPNKEQRGRVTPFFRALELFALIAARRNQGRLKVRFYCIGDNEAIKLIQRRFAVGIFFSAENNAKSALLNLAPKVIKARFTGLLVPSFLMQRVFVYLWYGSTLCALVRNSPVANSGALGLFMM